MRFPALLAAAALVLPAVAPAQHTRRPHAPPSATATGPEGPSIHITPITTGWQFHALAVTPAAPHAETPEQVLKDHPEVSTWRAATVPGTVHTDLAAAGIIPPPFVGDNEKRLQWIGLLDWEYRTTLTVTPDQLAATHAELVFDGLDTFADVTLNGEPLLKTDNQFRRYTADVHGKLHAGDNTLTILFHSAINTTAPVVAKLPYIIPGTGYEPTDLAHGIVPVGQYQRKAGYEYGWDWGPRFVTAGVFRPIHLDTWTGDRIRSLHLQDTQITLASASAPALARVTVRAEVAADTAGPADLSVSLTDPRGHTLPAQSTHIELTPGSNTLFLPLSIANPDLWYPAGYGPQSRYVVEARVLRGPGAAREFNHSNSHTSASRTLRTGLRSVELHRSADEWGKSFEFRINGIPVFSKGANVIPTDSFPPSTTPDRERDLLTSARDANMNMFRIWGGGYYQTDSFYDLCDELGIMVWQDFMFGAGMIPSDPAFQQSAKIEADQQVTRLADHPSLTIFNGNNEVEAAWNHWDGQKQFIAGITPDQREQVWQDYVVMFRDILKSAVAEHGNGIPYWPSSPSSNFEDPMNQQQGDQTVPQNGDMHSWKVWSAGAPITDYTRQTPRFLSEFGFQSLPDLRTLQAVVGSNTDLDSPELANHERFIHGFDRMRSYLAQYFRPSRDFPSTIYLSQLLQAEAIQIAVDHARASRPHTMGTLFWQLDDCWPVASWASLDYFGRWKALQYWARHFYAPISIAPDPIDPADSTHALRLHLVSDIAQPVSATLHLRLFHLDGKPLDGAAADQRLAVTLAPLSSTPVPPFLLGAVPGFDPKTTIARVTLEPPTQTPSTRPALAHGSATTDAPAFLQELTTTARSNRALDELLAASAGRTGSPLRTSNAPLLPSHRDPLLAPSQSLTTTPAVSNYPGSLPYPLVPSAVDSNLTPPTTLAERTVFFISEKDLNLPDPHIHAELTRDRTGYTVTLTSEAFARAVELSFGNLNWKLSDNYVDLLPGEPRTLHLTTTATEDQLRAALHTRSLVSATH